MSGRTNERRPDGRSSTSILVVSFGPDLADLSGADFAVYSRYYPGSRLESADSDSKLLETVSKGFDFIHLLCRISDRGLIIGSQLPCISCSMLLDEAYRHGTKTLFMACENPKEAYINAVKLAGRNMNIIMTLNRRGPAFAGFLASLTERMAAGDPMVRAWAKVSPQLKAESNHVLPTCIFAAGSPNATFSP